MQISAPLSVARDTSPESQAYMDAMRRATMTADQVPNRMPQANPGAIGSQEALANMREMFGDSTRGTIASSNSVLQEQGRSGALVNLQIRNSKSDEAKADAAYRGTLLGDHREKMVEYMHNLENGGMDFRNVMGGTVKQQLPGSPGAFVSGGRIDQIEQDYLNLFAQYATSDQGIEYLKNTTGIVGQADVFGGDQQEALNYMLQCMLTSAGASYQGVALASDTFEHGQEAKTIASEACRTLLMLPTLSRLGPDAMAELPAPIQTLVGQYMNLVRQIQDKMAA